MLKTGFRGERKRNPHPDHILSYSETSPKERGNVVTGKEKVMWWKLLAGYLQKGECSEEEAEERKKYFVFN